METRSRMSRSLHTNRDFEKLEPYEGKPSRTVLRGEEGSNALDLPDLPYKWHQPSQDHWNKYHLKMKTSHNHLVMPPVVLLY